jgi:aspartyl-tRNA(Asn)/glutamyl-tRNA(Gln) amidotransferase subunit A
MVRQATARFTAPAETPTTQLECRADRVVAVAGGMVPLALGTDTAASVRVPAALCGIVGYKPAYDAIPSNGIYPLAASLDHVGLFTGTVDEVRLAYEVLAKTGNIVCGWRPCSIID